MNLAKVSAEIGERARLGDQNAMATIAAVRASAKKGSKKAIAALKAIIAWLKAHPVKMALRPVHFGADEALGLGALQAAPHAAPEILPTLRTADALLGAVILLANGPLLTKPTIESLASSIEGEDERTRFRLGAAMAGKEPPFDAFSSAGNVVGRARKLQAVRLGVPGSIGRFSPGAAWELGDE